MEVTLWGQLRYMILKSYLPAKYGTYYVINLSK